MKPTLALIGATYFELNPLLRKLNPVKIYSKKGVQIYEKRWDSLRLLIVRCGVGAKNAKKGIEALLNQGEPEWVVSMGLCGAIDPSLKIADAVAPYVLWNEPNGKKFKLLKNLAGREQKGEYISVEHVTGADKKRELFKQNPYLLACDMESGAIAETLFEKGISLFILRHVSDTQQARFLPESILLENNRLKQFWNLLKYSKLKFPVDLWHLIRLGCHAAKAVRANTENISEILLFFIDNVGESP